MSALSVRPLRIVPPLLGVLVGTSPGAAQLTVLEYRGYISQPGDHDTLYKEVQLGDLDRDGVLDVYLPNKHPGVSEAPTIDHVYLGTGRPLTDLEAAFHFVPGNVAFPVPFTTSRGYDVELADLDGDGNLDVVRPDAVSHLVVLWGDGSGSFPEVTTLLTPATDLQLGNYDDVDCADLDGDGDVDFLVANYLIAGWNVVVENLLAQGSPRCFALHYAAGGLPAAWTHAVSLGDVDRDGTSDVVLANVFGLDSQLFGGSPGPPFFGYELDLGSTAGQATDGAVGDLVDLDGDGLLDVYVGRPGSSWMFFHSAVDTDPYPVGVPAPSNTTTVYDARYADLDQDGRLEVVTVDCCSSAFTQLRVITIDPDTRTAREVSSAFVDVERGSLALDLGDLDGDGDLDLAVGGSTGTLGDDVSAVHFYENRLLLRLGDVRIEGTADYAALKSITAGEDTLVTDGARVTLTAGDSIVLGPGFHALEGCELGARIAPGP